MSRNYQRIVEKLIHEQVEALEFLSIVEFEDKEGLLSDDEVMKVDQLLHKAHVLVYW